LQGIEEHQLSQDQMQIWNRNLLFSPKNA
jgi:hypothetical protein